MTSTIDIPLALTMQTKTLPWAHDILAPGLSIQLLVSDIEGGFQVVNTRFKAGTSLPTHLHTGAVHGHTTAGSWFYREYGDESLNVAGSYIYEPAGSTHTLHVPESNTEDTEALFIIHGAFLNYDADGNFVGHMDAANTREAYRAILQAQGDEVPEFVIGGTCVYSR
ncbi:2,4'-dihydroxyacetophenone dioxygenase family protein [Gordonia sp. VNK21]|uniref:2,4'-dihydroxyacetophenone dioxygenase family protein n=1 Tax=Gordonia sp. VNK21 TaxID=3382483 RepID=UPI0038D3A8E0